MMEMTQASQATQFSKHGMIALVTIDNPPVNALSHAVRAGLVEAVKRALADNDTAALVIICGGRTFIAGADIKEFGKPMKSPAIHEVIAAIENSSKPVIAAIHGTALGGGFEVAMACHYRVAVAGAEIGLPEVKLGIIPGAGGTQRLPRLVGVEAALKMIVDGTKIAAPQALSMGALDQIIDLDQSGDLRSGAIAYAERVIAEKRPLRKTSELPVRLDNPAIFDEMRNVVSKRQRGFPAPLKCIEAVKFAVDLPFVEASKREYELCIQMLNSPESRAQRQAFASEREVVRICGIDAGTPTRTIRSVAVIGPGTMGTGIAMCFINADLPVMLLGRDEKSLAKSLQTVRKIYSGSVSKGSIDQAAMDRRLALLTLTTEYRELHEADLVIEAVSEDMAAKKEVFRLLDAACKPGAILATNTSYLNIDDLAAVTSRPGDVVGTHFFNPANVMRLLENVRGAQTSPDVLATVMKVAKTIGKVATMVGMSDGFVGNRMLGKRSREGFFMMEEGATPWQIDKVLYDFGFPMGPYQVADLAGLDVAWAARKARFERLTEREKQCDILDQICATGRFGQKTGAGYYKYDDKRNATPDPIIEALIAAHSIRRDITRRSISDQEIRERCLFAMINEGAKILEEGVAARPQDIDVIWLHGFGFPAYRGGPMFYADQIGLSNVYDALLKYRDQVGGEYFTPASLLERLAKEGKGFYQ
jgi:3-hydroxyacyl-CoA dehydrogenase